jgi:sugar lactone lactonase YvrE
MENFIKQSLVFIAVIACQTAFAQDVYRLFQAEDFTKENLFTNNIEGPSFDAQRNLFVVNYQKDGTIGVVRPNGEIGLFLTLSSGSTANSIQFDSKGNMYLADFTGHKVLKVNMNSKRVKVYSHANFNQPNDLCINKKNQLFASDPNWKDGTGKIWRIDRNGKAVVLVDQMGTTNGITLSPDEKIIYVNESVQRKVWAFDVDAKGNLSNKRLFTEFADFGLDGMKCDNLGNLYVTRYGKGTIAVFTPEGKLIHEVQLKGKNCSNLVFGGLNGKLIYVTLQDRKGIEMFRNDIPGKNF